MSEDSITEMGSSEDSNNDDIVNINQELLELQNISFEDYFINARLRKRLRKFLKKINRLPSDLNFSQPMLDIPCANDPDLKVNTYDGTWDNQSKHIYTIIDSNDFEASKPTVKLIGRLLVTIPLTEVKGQFNCEFGSTTNPGKYCETEIHILSHHYYNKQRVTLLKLIPSTGRRHQLRLHCLAIGYPIVGDVTYASEFVKKKLQSTDARTERDVYLMPYDCHRMMLHAFTLR